MFWGKKKFWELVMQEKAGCLLYFQHVMVGITRSKVIFVYV